MKTPILLVGTSHDEQNHSATCAGCLQRGGGAGVKMSVQHDH